jgi:hypothetical protein
VTTPDRRREAQQVIDRLVASDRVKLHKPPLPRHPKEVAAALVAADGYLAEGSKASYFPAAQFGNLYTACIDAANSLVEAHGYVSRGDGGHEQVLLAAGALLSVVDPPAARHVAEVRNWMRPLRHAGTYENLSAVTPDDVDRARQIADALVTTIRDEIRDALGLSMEETTWQPG